MLLSVKNMEEFQMQSKSIKKWVKSTSTLPNLKRKLERNLKTASSSLQPENIINTRKCLVKTKGLKTIWNWFKRSKNHLKNMKNSKNLILQALQAQTKKWKNKILIQS